MTHKDKIRRFLSEVPRPGFGRWAAAPPLYRIAWLLGLQVRPPVFASYRANAIRFGLWFVLFWNAWMWLVSWGNDVTSIVLGVAVSIPTGAMAGAWMAGYFRGKARELDLPEWEDYAAAELADPEGRPSAAADRQRR